MRARGKFGLSVVVAAGLTGLGLSAPVAQAVTAPCWDEVPFDVDGAGPDVVVGLPSYDLPGKPDAGAIVVFSNVAARYSSEPRKPTAAKLLTADDFAGLSSQAHARFGAAVTAWGDAGSFDDPDNCADLMVGAPGQTVTGLTGAGQVYLLGSSGSGLQDVKRTFDENVLPGTGSAQAGAHFGAAIAADPWGVIAVGAPGRDVHEVTNAGRVDRIQWPAPDADPVVVVLEQDGEEDEGGEAGDHFGQVIDLMATGEGNVVVVGIPREDVGAVVDAGAVQMFPPQGEPSMMTQNRRHAGGAAEAADRYGAALAHWWTFTTTSTAMLAIGVPGEGVSGHPSAGMVSFASFALGENPGDLMTPLQGLPDTLTQDSARIPGTVEVGDQYGSSLLTGEFGQDNGRMQLVVGSPMEDLVRAPNAGMVSMTRFETDASPTTGSHPASWTQNSPSVAGVAEPGDRFGSRIESVLLTTMMDDEDVVWPITLVSVPREDVGNVVDAGVAYLGYPPGTGSVALVPPVLQGGAGRGMAPMRSFLAP